MIAADRAEDAKTPAKQFMERARAWFRKNHPDFDLQMSLIKSKPKTCEIDVLWNTQGQPAAGGLAMFFLTRLADELDVTLTGYLHPLSYDLELEGTSDAEADRLDALNEKYFNLRKLRAFYEKLGYVMDDIEAADQDDSVTTKRLPVVRQASTSSPARIQTCLPSTSRKPHPPG